jgi:hypothetical protein
MIIDCDSCTAGPRACADCVVSFLTIGVGEPYAAPALVASGDAGPVVLDPAEERALGVLAESGLVPPLRMERAM